MSDRAEAFRAAILARPHYFGLPLAEKPAFEFITGDGHHYAIFADGRVVGLDPEDGAMAINRIGLLIHQAWHDGHAAASKGRRRRTPVLALILSAAIDLAAMLHLGAGR